MDDPNLIRYSDPLLPNSQEEEVDLLYYVDVVRRHRYLVGGGIALSVLVAAIVSLVLPKVYEAEATLVPLSRASSSRLTAVMNDLGRLADLAGMSESVPREDCDLLVNVLESREVAARVIGKLDLESDLTSGSGLTGKRRRSFAVRKFRKDVLTVSVDGHGLIRVAARHADPTKAASIADAAVGALQDFLKEHQVSSAARARSFLENRLVEMGKELSKAEEDVRVFCETNGVISMPDQTRLLFEQIADLSSDVAVKRAQLDVLARYGGSNNPDASRLRAEIESLSKEIEKLEHGRKPSETTMIQTNGFIPLYHVPEKSLLYNRLLREVRVKQEVYAFLQTEVEAARLREARDQIAFTPLDSASAPIEAVQPRPVLIVSLTAVFAALATFMIASFIEYLERRKTAIS